MAAYIDREATVESLNALKPFLRDKGQVQLLRRVMNHIGKIPAADVKPVVHGRWDIRTDDYDCEYAKCSECGEEFYDANDDTIDIIFNYCPNCGARMDGE